MARAHGFCLLISTLVAGQGIVDAITVLLLIFYLFWLLLRRHFLYPVRCCIQTKPATPPWVAAHGADSRSVMCVGVTRIAASGVGHACGRGHCQARGARWK